jgi:hypothetical protein
MPTQEEILEIERKFWTGGPEVYRDHADDECTVVFSQMAQSMAREEIAGTAQCGRWRNVEIVPKIFRRVSASSLLVVYECDAVRRDGRVHHVYASSLYVSRDDGWKLTFHQQTEI